MKNNIWVRCVIGASLLALLAGGLLLVLVQAKEGSRTVVIQVTAGAIPFLEKMEKSPPDWLNGSVVSRSPMGGSLWDIKVPFYLSSSKTAAHRNQAIQSMENWMKSLEGNQKFLLHANGDGR